MLTGFGDVTFGLDPSGSPILTTDGTSQVDPASVCMPQGWYGPLAPGQVMCTAPPTTAAGGSSSPNPAPFPAACPSGATCSIVPGVPNTNIYFAVAAIASLFFFATAMGGHR